MGPISGWRRSCAIWPCCIRPPVWSSVPSALDDLERRLAEAMARRLGTAHTRLEPRRIALAAASSGAAAGARRRGAGTVLAAVCSWAQSRALDHLAERLGRAVTGLDARSPLATLARGYAIVTRLPDGQILRDPDQAPPGTRIEAHLANGVIQARVEASEPEPAG